MTREEAIIILQNEQPHCGKKLIFTEEEKYEAYNMALKALEQEPVLEKDGTLVVTTEHYENVGRVLVQYGVKGSLFYQG